MSCCLFPQQLFFVVSLRSVFFAVLLIVVHGDHHVRGSRRIFQLPQSWAAKTCLVRYSTIFYCTLLYSNSAILYPTLLLLSSTLLYPIIPTLPNRTQPCPTLLHAISHLLFLSAGPPWQAFWGRRTKYLTIRAGRTCAGGERTEILW